MTPFIGELAGTAILITLGDGVVANVLLKDSKGHNGGLTAVTIAWAIAVFTGVFISAGSSGAHLNPAVTIALAYAGKFDWMMVPTYIAAQMAGAMIGAFIVWIAYKPHFNATEDVNLKLVVFCTTPAIRKPYNNLVTEIVGTFVLIFGILHIVAPGSSLGALDALPVALLVLGIGLSLGGPTGYAINPARDLGPRIMHAILPIGEKRDSDWGYSWVPVLGPVIGAILAVSITSVLG